MAIHQHQFSFEVLDSDADLPPADQQLLAAVRLRTQQAYAPYSHFRVAAGARLQNGNIVFGTNQENASYPVGICAERVLLSALSSVQPNEAVDTIAISYHNLEGESNSPASPCGLCRQSLVEYEQRMQQPIRLLLAGQEGKILIVSTARDLLPFTFTAEDMR
jgi:cytidine deaminase